MTKSRDIAFYGVAIALAIMCALMFISTSMRYDVQRKRDALAVQNVQLAKDVRTATVRAFRDGLIVCGNEDIAYFQGVADQYPNTAVADVFNRMADNWAYDDDKMDELTEDYMDKEY